MYAGSTVTKEPEADAVGVNPTSDASIRAIDESGRPSWLWSGERPGPVTCVERPKKPDSYGRDSLAESSCLL
jgi:hypothetical protein